MRHARTPIAAAIALACACAAPRGTAERPAVTAIEIHGARELDAGDITERLATQASDPWWDFFWREARLFDEDAFANDQRRIVRYYQARGYYSARVLAAEAKPDGAGRVRVVFDVAEGKAIRVTRLDVVGLEEAPDVLRRAGRLPLRVGDVFTEVQFDATREALQLALLSSGFARAVVTQHADVAPTLLAAQVTYTVEHEVAAEPGQTAARAPGPGERYDVGRITIAGAGKVPRARVREEAEIALHTGETFDVTDLEKAQKRVFDLGVFAGVRVSQGPPDEAKKEIPVIVSVREAPFHTIRAGPSIGVAANRWDLSVVGGWTNRNWLGGLRKLSVDARAGYAWMPSPFSPREHGPLALLTTEFQQPGVWRRIIDFTARAELERGLQEGYTFNSERFRVATPVRFGRVLTIVPSYNLELYQLQVRGAISGAEDPGNELLFQCPGGCVLSYLEQRVTLDLRDDAINTHSGIWASFGVQEGFRVGGKGFKYLRFMPEVRAFVPLGPRAVLAGRLRLGILRPTGNENTPIVARFYSGGPLFMRGYYSRRLSPVAMRGAEVVPVGGDRLVDGSVELRTSLAGNLGGSLFFDLGNVTFASIEPNFLTSLQYAAGAGLRYQTPLGPVRLDLAMRLPTSLHPWTQPGVPVVVADPAGNVVPAPGSPVHHEPFLSVHLSLGEAF